MDMRDKCLMSEDYYHTVRIMLKLNLSAGSVRINLNVGYSLKETYTGTRSVLGGGL